MPRSTDVSVRTPRPFVPSRLDKSTTVRSGAETGMPSTIVTSRSTSKLLRWTFVTGTRGQRAAVRRGCDSTPVLDGVAVQQGVLGAGSPAAAVAFLGDAAAAEIFGRLGGGDTLLARGREDPSGRRLDRSGGSQRALVRVAARRPLLARC